MKEEKTFKAREALATKIADHVISERQKFDRSISLFTVRAEVLETQRRQREQMLRSVALSRSKRKARASEVGETFEHLQGITQPIFEQSYAMSTPLPQRPSSAPTGESFSRSSQSLSASYVGRSLSRSLRPAPPSSRY